MAPVPAADVEAEEELDDKADATGDDLLLLPVLLFDLEAIVYNKILIRPFLC